MWEKVKSRIYVIPVIIIYVVVISFFFRHYENTIEIIRSEYDAKLKLIETSIYNETRYTEIISQLAEKDLLDTMKKSSLDIMETYKKDSNILDWDYDALKKQLGFMDVYLLDQNLTVVASTIEEEIGLDLSAFPDFAALLKKRLEGDQFESDAINFSILSGSLKKYSYMPTQDNKYLIELSVNMTEAYPELASLNVVYLSQDLKDKYPFVEDITLFKFNKVKGVSHKLHLVDGESAGIKEIVRDRDQRIKEALEDEEIKEYNVQDDKNKAYSIKYVPYLEYSQEGRLTWWRSYAIEIIYNDQEMMDHLSEQKELFLESVIMISMIYFGFVFLIIYLIRKNQAILDKDFLTKLPNRRIFEKEMKDKMLVADKKNTKIALLFFDLDKFKVINDTYGHNFGDKILIEVATRIKSRIPNGDMASRLGGDEFTALVSMIESEDETEKIGKTVSEVFESPMVIDSHEIKVKASLGISIYPDHGKEIEELILKADNAMYQAKAENLAYKIFSGEIKQVGYYNRRAEDV